MNTATRWYQCVASVIGTLLRATEWANEAFWTSSFGLLVSSRNCQSAPSIAITLIGSESVAGFSHSSTVKAPRGVRPPVEGIDALPPTKPASPSPRSAPVTALAPPQDPTLLLPDVSRMVFCATSPRRQ